MHLLEYCYKESNRLLLLLCSKKLQVSRRKQLEKKKFHVTVVTTLVFINQGWCDLHTVNKEDKTHEVKVFLCRVGDQTRFQ